MAKESRVPAGRRAIARTIPTSCDQRRASRALRQRGGAGGPRVRWRRPGSIASSASGSGPWAANALFAEARLSAERGQREAARALLSAYLNRFPDGRNAADARALLIRQKGRPDEDRRRFAGARRLSWRRRRRCAVALPGMRAARAAEAPPMLVATPDPALLSALDAAFSPRGVRVVMADRALRATGDDLGARRAPRGSGVVVRYDAGPRQPFPRRRVALRPRTALCVRPHQGTVIVRRIAVTMPLSPEDAAALALSVQVALMPDAAAPAATVSPPGAGNPARARRRREGERRAWPHARAGLVVLALDLAAIRRA